MGISMEMVEKPKMVRAAVADKEPHGQHDRMKHFREFRRAVSWWAALLCFSAAMAPSRGESVRIIFDTDMGGDCDDVGALFMLHGAVERREALLLATMGCTSSPTIGPAIDAINTWFGRPDIPTGVLRDPGFKEGENFTDEVARRFPHQFPVSRDYPDAVPLYRRILAAQPEHSVIITAVGPLRNLANLLRSGPDAASPLDGRALVAATVRRLDVMGGKYPPHPSRDDKDIEYNFMADAASAAMVCETWPTPILFNGEGGSTSSGRRATFEMPEHNPLTIAYTAYPGVGYAGDRLSWDPVSVLVSLRGPAPWYREVRGGTNVVDPMSGRNLWRPGPDGSHSHLVLDTARPKHLLESALEDLMVAGIARPRHLKFDTAWHGIRGGTCQFSGSDGTDARRAFDDDDRTSWSLSAAEGWLQCRYGEGRRHRVTSWAVTIPEATRAPASLTLSASDDGGLTWTVIDRQTRPAFDRPEREFSVAAPAKHNLYRLHVTAANAAAGVSIASLRLIESIHCDPDIPVAQLTLDRASLDLPVHGRLTVNADVAPHHARRRDVAWTSSHPAIADVRTLGEQSATIVGRSPGNATLTASVEGVRQTIAVTVVPGSLPAGWRFDELGTPALPGAVTFHDGQFRITGCGHAMTAFWERRRDQGAFVSRPIDGDSEISACLDSLAPDTGGPAYQWDNRPPTAAGLMLRESVEDPLSRYLLVQVEASGKLVARWRDRPGDQDDNQVETLGRAELPVHLRLVREGTVIRIFTSTDGMHWGDPRATHTATFGPQARAGLCVCSGNAFATSTAVFTMLDVKE
ncbi:MAG: hypothetical protein RLZZ179_593 [Verrucomicrobiota bacterium]|jgi:pyrimidine-specific ribonucleoside hydrolase